MSDAGLARPHDEEQHLAKLLESLANPTRLALLRQLRRPRVVGEIRIRAEQAREGLPDDRPMARQGVKLHLERLIDAGFVQARQSWRGESEIEEYLILHARLFALGEEVRRLAALRPDGDPVGERTEGIGDEPRAALPAGKALVVVHGLGEGRAFRLDGPAEWLVGRQAGLAATLDYDPYVSSVHARLFERDGRTHVENVPGSRNGTFVNWARIGDAPTPLRHGDVIGVGKSLLLFRE